MDTEIISSLEQLKEVLNRFEVWDLTPDGALTMQSIWGDLFEYQLDMNNNELFVRTALAYEQDKDREWRA